MKPKNIKRGAWTGREVAWLYRWNSFRLAHFIVQEFFEKWMCGSFLASSMLVLWCNSLSWCHNTQHIDIQHYDTQHKWLICDTPHKWHSAWQRSAIRPSGFILSVAFYLLSCWLLLCWLSSCRVSWRLSHSYSSSETVSSCFVQCQQTYYYKGHSQGYHKGNYRKVLDGLL